MFLTSVPLQPGAPGGPGGPCKPGTPCWRKLTEINGKEHTNIKA